MCSETRDDRYIIYLGKWTCWYIIFLIHALQIKTIYEYGNEAVLHKQELSISELAVITLVMVNKQQQQQQQQHDCWFNYLRANSSEQSQNLFHIRVRA